MDNEYFMKFAIEEAKKSNENLKAGAVLVSGKKVISSGFNEKINDIGVHAEEKIFKNKSSKLKKSVLYVTIEPCSYRNYQPESCCDLIIKSGIKKVIVGMKDINPKVSGEGIKKLSSNGIKVEIFNGLKEELFSLLGAEYFVKHS